MTNGSITDRYTLYSLIVRVLHALYRKVAHSTTYCYNRNNSNSNNEEDSIFFIMTFMIMSITCCNQNKQATRDEGKSGTADMSDSLIDDTIVLML